MYDRMAAQEKLDLSVSQLLGLLPVGE